MTTATNNCPQALATIEVHGHQLPVNFNIQYRVVLDHDFFDAGTPMLRITLPLPPSANDLYRGSSRGGYPSPAYLAWLRESRPILEALLGDWEPDTEHWWSVRGLVTLPNLSDGHNYIKAAIDLLEGRAVAESTHIAPSGAKIKKGSILHLNGLFDNDRRVHLDEWRVQWTRHPEPQLVLVATLGATPRDWKEEAAAQLAAEKEAAREAKARERECARQAKEDANAAARAVREAERKAKRAQKEAEAEARRRAKMAR